jgi:hypothetical protein
MPGYIPDKLAEAYGKEEVDKYYRQSPFENIDIDRHGRGKNFHFPSFFSLSRSTDEESDGRANGGLTVENDQMMERVLLALERRDELAFMQQKEYERQGARLDEILTFIKARD